MGIVLPVAIDAGICSVPILLSDGMAVAADHRRVCALEGHVGASVIEGFRVQHRDRGVCALVLGVTRATEHRSACRQATVKSVGRLDVAGDGSVAREAEVVLGAAVEVPVAAAAVPRLALVCGDERARRHQALDVDRAGRGRGGDDRQEGEADNEVSHEVQLT